MIMHSVCKWSKEEEKDWEDEEERGWKEAVEVSKVGRRAGTSANQSQAGWQARPMRSRDKLERKCSCIDWSWSSARAGPDNRSSVEETFCLILWKRQFVLSTFFFLFSAFKFCLFNQDFWRIWSWAIECGFMPGLGCFVCVCVLSLSLMLTLLLQQHVQQLCRIINGRTRKKPGKKTKIKNKQKNIQIKKSINFEEKIPILMLTLLPSGMFGSCAGL